MNEGKRKEVRNSNIDFFPTITPTAQVGDSDEKYFLEGKINLMMILVINYIMRALSDICCRAGIDV